MRDRCQQEEASENAKENPEKRKMRADNPSKWLNSAGALGVDGRIANLRVSSSTAGLAPDADLEFGAPTGC